MRRVNNEFTRELTRKMHTFFKYTRNCKEMNGDKEHMISKHLSLWHNAPPPSSLYYLQYKFKKKLRFVPPERGMNSQFNYLWGMMGEGMRF